VGNLEWSDRLLDRYSRQLVLPGWDLSGQERIARAHIMLIGCGGLGWSAALLLAGAGIGTLTVVDGDTVALSNLHRQLAFTEADVGQPKAQVLAARARALNAQLRCHAWAARVDEASLRARLDGVDLLLEASDSDATRRAVNAACRDARLPWISAAAQAYEGRLVAFDPCAPGPCYACLYPAPLRSAPGCAALGVFAPVVTVTGSLLAAAALHYLLGEPIASGQLQLLDQRRGLQATRLELPRLADCPVCAPVP